MIVSKYFVWFILFSFVGWAYETLHSLIVKHCWENRGFLFGPICPIYGVGAVSAGIICTGVTLPAMKDWQIFVICFFGSIVLEYVTSYVLEKLFHAIWWDYSKAFLNIHGRVCLFASIGFGVAGIFVVHVAVPFAQKATGGISPLAMEILALVFMAIFAADMALTVSALTSLTQNLQTIEQQVNRQMEELYASFEENLSEKKQYAIEKKEELTRNAVESMSRLLNVGQRHALHSVEEFHYAEQTSKFSNYLIRFEKEVRQKAKAAQTAAINTAGVVKEKATETAGNVKEKATETAGAVKEKATETAGAVKEKAAETAGAVKEKITENRKNEEV